MHRHFGFIAAAALVAGCGSHHEGTGGNAEENSGEVEVALTNAPSDAACLRITVSGARTDVRSFGVTPGQAASFNLKGLPVGNPSVSADAFQVACDKIVGQVDASWYAEAVSTKISAQAVAHVALRMIHNGRLSVGVDFNETNSPTPPAAVVPGAATFSSQAPYLVPVAPGVQIKAILTVGDQSSQQARRRDPLPHGGLPDGLGAFDNGDGTFTLLSNHEIRSGGIVRAHGGKGAFVSKWTIRKSDLPRSPRPGLIKTVALLTPPPVLRAPPPDRLQPLLLGRPARPQRVLRRRQRARLRRRLFLNGEETGNDGHAPWAHGLRRHQLRACPRSATCASRTARQPRHRRLTTVVAGTDDSDRPARSTSTSAQDEHGQPRRAGRSHQRHALRAQGRRLRRRRHSAAGIPTGPLHASLARRRRDADRRRNSRPTATRPASRDSSVPKTAPGIPRNPNDFYFVTTAAFTAPSRLWRAALQRSRHPDARRHHRDAARRHRRPEDVRQHRRRPLRPRRTCSRTSAPTTASARSCAMTSPPTRSPRSRATNPVFFDPTAARRPSSPTTKRPRESSTPPISSGRAGSSSTSRTTRRRRSRARRRRSVLGDLQSRRCR